jgi:hypothetical protein
MLYRMDRNPLWNVFLNIAEAAARTTPDPQRASENQQ